MKRLLYILIVLVLLIGISSISFAASTTNYISGGYELDPPRRFDAIGFQYIDTTDPFNRLQNMMEFTFINGNEIHKDYTVTLSENEHGGPAEFVLSMDVTYNRDMAETFTSVFITGTFTFRQDSADIITEYTGMVNGSIVFILPENMGFSDPDLEAPAILLQFMSTDNSQWAWYAYLDTPNDDLVCCIEDSVDLIMQSDYMHHESRPHIPSPWKQSDVAAGVGISTIGIVVLNALTKTSVFGNASFNGSFDPASAGPGGQSPSAGAGGPQAQAGSAGAAGTSASTGAGASASSTIPNPQTSAGMSGPGSGGGFFGVIRDFFRRLFLNLRDMLTDEGRSYASGKLSETLENIVPDDVDKE